MIALHRVEISLVPGSGKLKIGSSPDRRLRDSINTVFDYVYAIPSRKGIERELQLSSLNCRFAAK